MSRTTVICLRCVRISQLAGNLKKDIERIRLDRDSRPPGTPVHVLLSSRINILKGKLAEVEKVDRAHRASH